MDTFVVVGFVALIGFLVLYYNWLNDRGISLLSLPPVCMGVLLWILFTIALENIHSNMGFWNFITFVALMMIVVVVCYRMFVMNRNMANSAMHGILMTIWQFGAAFVVLFIIACLLAESGQKSQKKKSE